MFRTNTWITLTALTVGFAASGACAIETTGEDGFDYERADRLPDSPNGVFVHLFEWKWTDIANECEQFLGPKGFSGVQISPPNEHIVKSEWWARYQPVSYKLESRSGTRAQFINMVNRCNAVGVDIIADMVINHTAAANTGSAGWAGSTYGYKSHPAIAYSAQDYHTTCAITNYGDAGNVQYCELVGLPDLNTSSSYVQDKIANYMKDLTSLGVAGFRIDAAKHIAPADIQAILTKAGNPPVFSEVIGAFGEAVQPSWYTPYGHVTEFGYSRDMGNIVLNGQIKNLRYIGDGKLASADAVVFVDNHDNQRGHGAGYMPVTYKNGSKYNLANAFMLAWPYGKPALMSSYEFTNGDHGPPAGGGCGQPGWVCEHRWTTIANMVEFRRVTAGQVVANWWDNGNNRIAFSRGNKGFIAINNESGSMSQSLQTGMAAGTYCDIGRGNVSNGTCSGPTITVASNGTATISINAYEVAAIHAGTKMGTTAGVDVAFTCQNGTTYLGQSVYVVGSVAELGNWSPASAVKLNPTSYPTWTGTIRLPASTRVEWKCLKREEANPSAGVVWQPGSNNVLNTPASGTATATASF